MHTNGIGTNHHPQNTMKIEAFLMAYLHCWTWIQVPTPIRIPNPMATCTMQNMFTLHGLWFRFLSSLQSLLYPFLEQISVPGLGSQSVSSNVNKSLLVSLHTHREYLRCSKSKLGCENFVSKIPWVPQLKYLRNVLSRVWCVVFDLSWSSVPDWGTLDLSWSTVTPPPPPTKWKLGQIEGHAGNLCVETNCCILCGYYLVLG